MREIRTSGSMRGEWVVLLTDIAHSPTLPRNESSVKQGFAQRRKDPQRRKESLSIDQPSGNLFENGFRFGLDLLFRLILDRVCHIDRVEV